MITIGSLLFLILFASQMYVWINWWPIRIDFPTALAWSLPQYAVWTIATPIARQASIRWPIGDSARAPRFVGHLLGSIAFSVLGLATVDGSDRLLHWAPLLGAPKLVTHLQYTIIQIHWGTAVYWLIVAGDHVLRLSAESRDRAAEADRATLTALRSQLNPHFLFNTLNSVAVLIRQDPSRAEEMVHRLARFFRMTLDQAERSTIALADEVAFVNGYLEIERSRFEHRLIVEIAIDRAAASVAVPTLILQPLVENAVRHGIARLPRGGTVRIVACRVVDRIVIAVSNDAAPSARVRPETGFGIESTRRRLATLYQNRCSFAVTADALGTVTARLELPVE